MVPETITRYLDERGVPYELHAHPLAVSATRLAEALGISGHRVAKAVLVCAGGELVLAVVPSTTEVDLDAVARLVEADHAELADEELLAERFPGCELGAAPPFGKLWEVPVVVDVLLAHPGPVYFRGGTHEDVIRLDYVDFADLEDPLVSAVTFEGEQLAGGELPHSFGADAF